MKCLGCDNESAPGKAVCDECLALRLSRRPSDDEILGKKRAKDLTRQRWGAPQWILVGALCFALGSFILLGISRGVFSKGDWRKITSKPMTWQEAYHLCLGFRSLGAQIKPKRSGSDRGNEMMREELEALDCETPRTACEADPESLDCRAFTSEYFRK